MVVNLYGTRLRMNSLRLVDRIYTNLEADMRQETIQSLEENFPDFVLGMEGYLNNNNYQLIPTPNDGQCAIHSIVEVANLIASENGKQLITDEERTDYIGLLSEATQNPASGYVGDQTSTHHEIYSLLF